MTVEMERKFLKKWQHTLPGKVSKLRIYKTAYPVTMMANLLDVSVSRFYDGLKQGLSQRAIQRNQQTILVKIDHQESNESYSHMRLS